MSYLMPVNINEATVVSRASAVAGITATKPDPPKVSDLASWSQENYQLDVKAAAHLGFPIVNVDADYHRQLLIFGTSRWADVDSGDGHVYRFGVSLRVLVEILSADGKVDLTLPAVAPNVQLGTAQASAQLIIRGYNSSSLGKLLPPWQSFTVDSYAQYMSAISQIQVEIMAHDENVVPQLLATTIAAQSLPSSAQSIGRIIALRAISEGKNLRSCLDENRDQEDDVKDAITQSYTAASLGSDDDPDAGKQAATRKELGSLAQTHHWWRSL